MNSYEEFLQAIDELYDQNKLDFNNYKLLKKELESIESEHEKQKSEYRNYFKMLESKIKNLVVSGGGLTENQVENIVSNYVITHKSELTGARGPQGPVGPQGSQGPQGPVGPQGSQGPQGPVGPAGVQGVKGSDGLTTQIRVNGTTYTQSNGLITLPDYPTLSGSGSGLTTTQEQQITIAYNHSQSAHAPSNAEQNVQSNWNETNASSDAYILNKPTLSTVATSGSYNDLINKPSTITISFNGNTYRPDSNGVITLPNVGSSGGSSGSINTSNFITFNDSYVGDCNKHYVNGYTKTNLNTKNLPPCYNSSSESKYGILFCILENSKKGTGSQMHFPISGDYKGRIFVRSVRDLKESYASTSVWSMLQIDTAVTSVEPLPNDIPLPEPGELNKGGNVNE